MDRTLHHRLVATRAPAVSTTRRKHALAEPSLAQCVLLSMLLHLLLVLVVGTADRGGGQRTFDLDATLAPYLPDSGYRARISPATQPAGRESGPTPPLPASPRRGVTPSAPAEPPAQTPQPTDASSPPEVPAVESLPSLDRGAPEVVDKAIEPLREEALPRELLRETIPRVNLEVQRALEPAMAPIPPAAIQRQMPAPTPPPPPAVPRPRPAAEPENAPILETPTPAPQLPLAAPPTIEREIVAPEVKATPLPPIAPPTLNAPLQEQLPRVVPEATRPIVPETPAPALEAPPVLGPPVLVPPAAAPPAPAPPMPRAETPALRPLEPAPTAAPAAPAAAPVVPQSQSTSPGTSPRVDSERTGPRDLEPARPAIAPPRDAPAVEPLPRLKFGAPEEPDDIFKPRAAPPIGVVPPVGQAPRLNLEAARKEKAETEIGRSAGRKGIFNLDSPPPEAVSKLGRAIQKAAQPDCRDAYAALGLLAAPFLLFDTITDTGCRWR